MYDLIIVGAGPAGATLARLAAKQKRILILDRRDLANPFSGGQEKCCGGLLAPAAQKILAQFGLGLPSDVLVGPQLFTVRTLDLATKAERYYSRNYINIDREKFDRWLVSLVPTGVERCWRSVFLGAEKINAGYRVTIGRQGKTTTADCRLLIGADGAWSSVRNSIVGATLRPQYVAVQEWFLSPTPLPYYSAIFEPAVTDFYAWTIPKDETVLIGAAIPAGTGVQQRFELLKQRLACQGYDLSRSWKKRGCHLMRPASPGQICLGREDTILIGEAAGWISPSSAEGISYAFRSGLALAQALAGGEAETLTRYRGLCRPLYLNIAAKIAKGPVMYWPPLRRLAMGSGLLSLKLHKGADPR